MRIEMEIQRKEVRSTEVGALAAPHAPWHGSPPDRWVHQARGNEDVKVRTCFHKSLLSDHS
jgi:hypothetical protein